MSTRGIRVDLNVNADLMKFATRQPDQIENQDDEVS